MLLCKMEQFLRYLFHDSSHEEFHSTPAHDDCDEGPYDAKKDHGFVEIFRH